jgi:Holliday junction resolvase RusA-like endonuclease
MGIDMTFQVMFTVEGKPIPKGRPRFARRGNFVSTYSPKTTVDYELKASEAARQAMGSSEPLETPVSFFCYITIPIPKSYSKKRVEACLNGFEKPTKKPDWDNIAKAIADSINGIVYIDDCQIVNAHVAKRYGTVGMVEVLVKEDI